MVWPDPANAVPGTPEVMTFSVAVLVEQIPLLTLHCRLTEPIPRPVKPLVPSDGVLIPAEPESNDQVPTPVVGMLPVSCVVGVVIQTNCVGPTVAVVGTPSTWIAIVELLEQPPLVSFHCKILVPTLRLVTEVLERLGAVSVPLPTITDQVPIPMVGELPARTVVGVAPQSVWLDPATAVPVRL